MEKIKFFILTLLCMVGVIGVNAEIVTGDTKTQYIKQYHDDGSVNGVIKGSTAHPARWISSDYYEVNHNSLWVFDNATDGSSSMSFDDDGNLVLHCLKENTITIYAPEGWCIESFKFIPTNCSRAYIEYNGQSYGEDETVEDSNLMTTYVKFNMEHQRLLMGQVVCKDFEVKVKKLGVNPISELMNREPFGVAYWEWVQERPVERGKLYKIINCTVDDSGNIQAVGQNSGSSERDYNERTIESTLEDAGEWLFAEDGSINIISGKYPEARPFWDGLFSDNELGWDLLTIADGNYVRGFQITAFPQTFTRYYITADDGSMGRHAENVEPSIGIQENTVWNFYSIAQYNCYVDYKAAYEAFMGLNTEDADPEYVALYNSLKDEVEDYTAKGNTQENRDDAYAMIQKMLDMVAIFRPGGGDVPEDLNFGAEDKELVMKHWTVSMAITGEKTSRAIQAPEAKLNGDYGFSLVNATMHQKLAGLKPGIYKVSVNWKSGRDGGDTPTDVEFYAESSAEHKSEPLKESSTWDKMEYEIVVVDGTLTIGATANTNTSGWAYLDDFEVKFVEPNRKTLVDNNTWVYKGVFQYKSSDPEEILNVAEVTDAVPYADITAAYGAYFKFNNSQNPNGLCYAKQGKEVKVYGDETKDAINVIRGSVDKYGVMRNGVCDQLKLEDKHPYSAKAEFMATKAHYDMISVGTDALSGETFGSLMLPYAAVVPSGVHAYTAEVDVDGRTIKLTDIGGVIPANTPVLVDKKDKFDAETVVVYDGTLDVDNGIGKNGDLVGVYHTTEAELGWYILQLQKQHLAYYLVTKTGLHVAPFRTYLEYDNTGSAKAPSFSFMIVETDGISNVDNISNIGAVYDLSGRRVEKMTRGMYIVNGKKVLVK